MRFRSRHSFLRLLVVAYAYILCRPLPAAVENSTLMGGFYIIGNDDAAEAGENPAYLVAGPDSRKQHSTATRLQAGRTHNLGVTGVGSADGSQWFAAGDVSYVYRGLLSNRLALGFSAMDVRAPVYSTLKIDASVFLASLGNDMKVMISNRASNSGIAAGAGLQLTPRDSVGFRIKAGNRVTHDKNTSKVSVAGNEINYETLTTTGLVSLTATLSYLHHRPAADFTVSVGNLGMEYSPASFAYSESLTNGGTMLSSRYESQSWINRYATDPFLAVGLRQRLFADIHLFAEGIAQPALQASGRENIWRDTEPKGVVARDFVRDGDPAFSAGVGIAAGLGTKWTIHMGARAQKARTRTHYTASDNNSREKKSEEYLLATAGLGASFRSGNLTIHGGIMYLHQEVTVRRERSSSFNGVDFLAPSNISVTVDAYSLFVGASTDF